MDISRPDLARFLTHRTDSANGALGPSHTGQSVLVTGAGGYIGSALVRTIAQAAPRHLILLDSSEQNLFEIERDVNCSAFLGSVEDPTLLEHIFNNFHPDTIYHAAAFKHVPLLESNPFPAVRNNALGTYALAQAALRHGVSRLVLISTDKAVNPHSIMGASKRIAELAVVSLSTPRCRMSAIRLANVIGSPGSVVPIFLKQIADGGPVTVTHPEVSRWFLSLEEAVESILECAGCGGCILLPRVDEPVRIAELAEYLICHAAKKSSGEIPMVFTGLRPGDKLTEELSNPSTDNAKLMPEDLAETMERLAGRIAERDVTGLLEAISSIVPEYVPSDLLR